MLSRRIYVEEVLHGLAEGSIVRTDVLRQLLLFAILVNRVDRCAHGAFFVRSVIETTRCLIVTIECTDVIVALGHLAFELAVEVVPINVAVTVAVGDVGKVVVVELQATIGSVGHILRIFLTYGQFAFRGTWIGHVDVHAVLVTVECHDCQLLGVRSKVNAGYVAVGIERQLHGAGHAVLDVEGHDTHVAVLCTGYGVFVTVLTGILIVLHACGISSLKLLDCIDRHLRLVVAHPSQHLAVC